MHKVVFSQSINSIDDLYSKVKREYTEANIPTPFPAANRQLQLRLVQFVNKGVPEKQQITYFGKVNSKRVYALEKHDNRTRLVVMMNESDKAKKLIVLSVDNEIKMIVASFIEIFKETGYIASATKCHERLSNSYAISNKRMRMVQRIVSKFICPLPRKNVNENSEVEEIEHESYKTENGGKEVRVDKEKYEIDDDKENSKKVGEIEDKRNDIECKQGKDDHQHRNVTKDTHVHNHDSSLLLPLVTTSQRTIMTRSQFKLNQIKHVSLDKRSYVNEFDKAKKTSKNSNNTN